MLASMLGFILVMLIMFFISVGIIMGLMSIIDKQEVVVKENTVIRIDFKDPIPERTPKNDIFSSFAAGYFKTTSGIE